MTDTATTTDTAEVEAEALSIVEQADALAITNAAEYEAAGSFLLSIKGVLDKIEATWRPMQRAADAAKKAILDQRREVETPVKTANGVVSRLMGDYDVAQERLAAKAKAKAEREAREQAEAEQLAQAAELEAQGRTVEAEIVVSRPPAVMTPPPSHVDAPPKPKAAGITTRKTWKFEIVDEAQVKPEYTKPDEVAIGKVVRALGDKAESAVGGIKVWQERNAVRSSR